MRSFTLTCSLVVACGLVAHAGPESIGSSTKEMKESVAPAPPPCDFRWTGFYLGGNVGYDWASADTRSEGEPSPAAFDFLATQSHDPEPEGVVAGGQIGFNLQIGRWFLLGAEADFQGADVEGTEITSPVAGFGRGGAPATPNSFLYTSERMNYFGSFRGRIGFVPWCRLMIYGTGGLAYGDVDYRGNALFIIGGGVYTESAAREETNAGWTAGGGLEFAVARHWTIKAEYLYYDLGDQSATGGQVLNGVATPPFGVHYNWDTTGNIARAGLNFKF
jgi:outer membrane immunogenic protein